jgi:beta-glucanase (GH16 family)
VGWPNCGEIDVMEHVLPIGPNTVRGSAHGPNYSGANSVHGDATLADLAGAFHVFTVEWAPTELRWYVDGVRYFSATPPLPGPWVFDHPFFIILNLAIGGDWPGPPDGSTLFPVKMLVDWVRVYRDSSLPPPPGLPLEVSSLQMSTALNGPNWQAIATVTVTDANGVAQSGVTVLGAWSQLTNVGVTQATTDSNGVAVLSSGRVRQSGTIRFCVTDLIKAGHEYESPVGGDCGQITR